MLISFALALFPTILIYLSCLWIQSSKEESAYDSCTLLQL